MDKPIRILLIDDNPDDRALVQRALKRDMPKVKVEQVTDKQALKRAIKADDFDVVITDFHIGWTDGLNVLHEVKSRNQDCPVIMFTGTGDEKTAVAAMKAGLDDYIIKTPAHFERLPAAVRNAMDRKAALAAIRDRDLKLTTLISNLPGYVYQVANDRDYTLIFISDGVVRVTGYTSDEYLVERSITCGAEIHQEDRNKVWEIVQAAVAKKIPYECEYRIFTKSGDLRWVWERGRGVFSAKGELLMLDGFVTDITERKNAEKQLVSSRSLLQSTLESTTDGILVVDAEGIIKGYNKRFVNMWGLPIDIMDTRDDACALQFVLDKLKDPDGFLTKVKYLYSHPDLESFDILEFNDGRFFERYSIPQYIDGKPVGRVWSFRDITERKKSEDMLARFGRILDGSLNEIYVFDAESLRFTQVNRGALLNLGYSMDELRKMTPIDLKPDFTRESFEELIEPLRTGEREMVAFTTVHRRKYGSLYPVDVRLQLLSAESPPVFVAIIEDITERARATDAMRKLSSAIEQTADIVIITDRDGVIEYVNPAFEHTTGFTVAEALGNKPSLIKSGRHDKEFYRDLWDTILSGKPYRNVFINRRKDGHLYHEEKSITPLRDASGVITHFVSTGKDISDRILAEDSLRASEEHLRTIIDTEPECIKLVDSRGLLVDMNAAGLAMIDADSLEQVAGKPIADLVLPEYRQAFNDLIKQVLGGGKGMLSFEIMGLKGRRRWMETHAVPMNTQGGETVVLGITRDITERKHAEDRLSYLAHHDSLTGLPNRALFNDRLHQAMIEAERHDRLLAVVFLDLDRFKNVNDTLGHDAGDLLLKGVAERLLGAVRRGDTVARLSGDEFTLVLADMGHVDDAARVAQKILDVFTQPFHVQGRDLVVTASLGITIFPFDTQSSQELLRNADIAMYRAKELGRNSYQFYTAEMTTKAVERMGLESDLRDALKRGEFELHYQPIVSCREGRILGVEALVRWRSPTKGLVPPLEFIPLAEETGLIIPIGERVLQLAVAQLTRWHADGFSDLKMSVNLSVRQFRQKTLAHYLGKALANVGLSPDFLELEITETVLAQGEETSELLQKISALGVQFSIDDFGVGYSSLSYLKRLPIDAIKIDRSFVQDIPGDADDTAITAAIIAMAKSLDMRVIAEGVETAEQLSFLCNHSCDAMQGYFLSRPLPAEEMTAMLRSKRVFCLPTGAGCKPAG